MEKTKFVVNCIGDIEEKNTTNNSTTNPQFETQITHFPNNNESNSVTMSSKRTKSNKGQYDQNPQSFKRGRSNAQYEEEQFTQNSSSNEIKSKISDSKEQCDKDSKGNILGKQHIYSKNYRQRKKQHTKLLQEQNEYLRQKIRDLQFRLREMQLQINRLKFKPDEKQFTIEQLNEEFMSKVTIIMEKNKQNPNEYRSKYQPSDPFYQQFQKTYAQHGFGGTKKLEIMNYYYNEILQAMLRDSQRYFSLMCIKSKDGESIQAFPQYETINMAFFDILQPDQQKLQRLKVFQINLHPMVHEFIDSCKQFNAKFNKILKSMQKIHDFMRLNYPANFDFGRKRILQLQPWFQKHKYTKMMRNLRVQWLEQIKKQVFDIDQKKLIHGNKKKKAANKDE